MANPRPTLPLNQLDVTTFPARFSQSGQCQSSTLTLETTLAMASVFARKMHSTTKFTMTVLSKCVCVCVCMCVCPSCQKSTQSSLTIFQDAQQPLHRSFMTLKSVLRADVFVSDHDTATTLPNKHVLVDHPVSLIPQHKKPGHLIRSIRFQLNLAVEHGFVVSIRSAVCFLNTGSSRLSW